VANFARSDLGKAPVDKELGAVDVARGIRCEEHGSLANFARVGETAERNSRSETAFEALPFLFGRGEILESGSVGSTGREDIDTDLPILEV